MSKIPSKNSSLPEAIKSPRCFKVKCRRSLSRHHPISYTNGLCERHFFAIDLSPNDDINSNNKSKEKKISSIKHHYQPLRDDIRKTHEIFDGRQW